jgi:cytochrome c-type biogenesis protein CcmH
MNHGKTLMAKVTLIDVRSYQVERLWRPLLIALILAMGWALVLAGYAQAQQPTPSDNEVNVIAKQLFCPVCENVPLDVCPTQACEQWRQLIREKLAEGWDEDRIKDYFVEQYGARVLAAPPAEGLNWLAYLVPPIAILSGAYILYRAMKSWQKPAPEVDTQVNIDESPDDEYIARLEEELRRR